MNDSIVAFRAITAALGFFLIGKLLFEYFTNSPRVRGHPDPRVRQLNRVRVYSVMLSYGSLAIAVPALMLGLPFAGFLLICGIAIVALVVALVCTARVILITGHL